MNPVLARLNKVDNGRAGRLSEKRLARRVKGVQRIGSGAVEGMKGDVVKNDYLIEAKSTVSKSFILHKEWLLKIYQEALEISKIPCFAISFTDDQGRSEKRERWLCVPEHIWIAITEEANQKDETG